MHKDAERVDMPESTYRDALNANLYFTKGSVVNEQGNISIGTYSDLNPEIVNIIGQCVLEDGRIVIFAIDNGPIRNNHVISIADPKLNTYRVLYRDLALNFQKDYTIEATAKVDSKGQIKVYFTDNYISRLIDSPTGIDYIDDFNPPRVFDVTKQIKYLDTPGVDMPAGQTRLYGNSEFTVDKLDIFMHSGDIPEFTTVNIIEGGGVISGTYHLALAYMDEDRNTTNYLITSNAVHIVTSHEDSLPTESITGDPQGSQSNKSITWNFKVPIEARNYTHLQPVVIQRFGGGQNQASSEFAYALDPVAITPQLMQSITYTGLETVAQASISEVVIDSVRYETSKTIVQLDNRLYISNLQSRGDIGYQRFANSITLEAVTEEIKRFDPRHFDVLNINKGYTDLLSSSDAGDFKLRDVITDVYKPIQGNSHEQLDVGQKGKFSGQVRKGYKDVSLSYKKKSYRRSEVYAFYISFVLKDGTETYAYHIPGRTVKEIGSTGFFENEAIQDHTANDFKNTVGLDTTEFNELYEDSKLHQITDTQLMIQEVGNENISTSFWENNNEYYPESEDYQTWETDEDGVAVQTGTIAGENVRHHKMPSNKHKDYSYITGIEGWDFFNSNIENQFAPNVNNSANSNQDLELKENIRLLGIKLGNIHIPKFILSQVQGYKVYYAKRRQRDKTIIGQSIPLPATLRGNAVPSMYTKIAKYGPYHRAWFMSGVVESDVGSYPKIDSKFSSANFLYRGFPVFKFHDFNLLKNKHTLSGASHVDVQSILVFRHYGGGPAIRRRLLGTLKTYAGTEWGPNSEIGNNIWPNTIDSETAAEQTSIRAWVTATFLASGYLEPKAANYMNALHFSSAGDTGANLLDNIQSIYTVQPKSITYLPGHTHLESTDSGAYHGAKFLLNFAGESAMAVGLTTGLPMLTGYIPNAPDYPLGFDLSSGRMWWKPRGGWLNDTNGETGNSNHVMNISSPNVQGSAPSVGGQCTTYLINLCSLKENVYDSFDEQQLVWTGHYKTLNDIDLETGEDSREDQNYFTGASTDNIFGGDTYITRYGFRSTSLTYGHHYFRGNGNISDIPFNYGSGTTGDVQIWPSGTNTDNTLGTGGQSDESLEDSNGNVVWGRGNNSPIAGIYYFFCESDDLIGYRHSADAEAGVLEEKGRFFDGSTANSVLFNSPVNDNTHMDNLLYMNNYSLNQDLRVTVPLPKKLDDITLFPTRTIRSNSDEGSINDKYREYLALEAKDIPKNRGDIWNIFTLGSVLYMHTQKSLFVTKGKENLQLGDASQAFIGSGDIFAQEPDELIPTAEGYGGTDSQFASITTRYGHFYVNRNNRKVFMFSSQIEEISAMGMEKWFLDNIPYRLEDYGIDLDQSVLVKTDAPTDMFGFTSAYDPKYKRIILTKNELNPTALFIQLYNDGYLAADNTTGSFEYTDSAPVGYEGLYGETSYNNSNFFIKGGWTVSYYPETKVWGSRHSYTPRLYAYNSSEYYSLVNLSDVAVGQIWEHSDDDNPGNFFGAVNNFEFEYIDNTLPGASKIFSTAQYWTEVQANSNNNATGQVTKHTSPGFTSFYVYNTKQISGTGEDINYLSNTRLVDKFWYINDFRDKSSITTLTNNDLVTGVANVQENFTTGVQAATQTETMFTDEGVVNPTYIDNNKQWYDQRRFVDHYLGVRLICDNSSGNLVHLFAAGTKHRKSFR